MVNSLIPSMYLPYTLFETIKPFNDMNADDMQYGDMGEQELQSLGLRDVSSKVDPYRLVRYVFSNTYPLDSFFRPNLPSMNISHEECVDILFTEMKELSTIFSFHGEYKMVIGEMIDHFRYGNGGFFYSERLNSAFHDRINKFNHESPIFKIKYVLHRYFTFDTKKIPFESLLYELKGALYSSRLTKFNSVEDRVNGLGISVHDISAQSIRLLDLNKYAFGWSATLYFQAQDHFGLDANDINSKIYSQFRFFRIWFFLQRHKDFAFKPFFTDFNSVLRIGEYI